MQCPVCGSENFRVTGNPKRGISTDLRPQSCCDCGVAFTSVTTIPYIVLNGENIAIEEARRLKIIEELQDKYLENKKRRFKQNDGASLF